MARSFLLVFLGSGFGDVADDKEGANDHIHDNLHETVFTFGQ